MNVNISNELNFSNVYRSVNYIRSLAKFTRTRPNVVYTSINTRKMKFMPYIAVKILYITFLGFLLFF